MNEPHERFTDQPFRLVEVRYFTDASYTPTALLRRRAGHLDDAFVGGVWRPTTSIFAWMAGENDFVDEINAAEALLFAPEAF